MIKILHQQNQKEAKKGENSKKSKNPFFNSKDFMLYITLFIFF